jgi:hypothetical protein
MLAILMLITLVGLLCAAAFNAAVYVVPLMAGYVAGKFAYTTGAGLIGAVLVGAIAAAVLVGAIAAAVLFGVWQALYQNAKSTPLRFLLIGLFCLPAGFAGYHLLHGLAVNFVPSPAWQLVFSIAGALLIAASAAATLQGQTDETL